MTEPTAPFDVRRAHRWFAVEFNNRAWELVELPTRSPEQTAAMLDAAHAAGAHWREVGDVLNHLRAQCLLATAYASANEGAAAERHARQCLALLTDAGERATPWDHATAHGCAALDDRAVFEKFFRAPTQ